MIRFVLVNECSDKELTVERLQDIAAAILAQLNGEVSIAYGGGYAVRVASSNDDVQLGECAIWIQDTIIDPGADGYHTSLANGCPVVYVARETVSDLTSSVNSLSVVISHECCEVAGNPGANLFAVKMDGTTEQARELCDRVEDTAYPGFNGVMLSNFLLPSAFNPGAPGPFDHLGLLLDGEGRTPGGYEIDVTMLPRHDVSGRAFNIVGTPRRGHRAYRMGYRAENVNE